MKSFFRQNMLLFVGVVIGFAFAYLLLASPLFAQTEDQTSGDGSYALVTKQYWEASQEESLQEFAAGVEERMQEGWKCLGPPVLAPASGIHPASIMQAMTKE